MGGLGMVSLSGELLSGGTLMNTWKASATSFVLSLTTVFPSTTLHLSCISTSIALSAKRSGISTSAASITVSVTQLVPDPNGEDTVVLYIHHRRLAIVGASSTHRLAPSSWQYSRREVCSSSHWCRHVKQPSQSGSAAYRRDLSHARHVSRCVQDICHTPTFQDAHG